MYIGNNHKLFSNCLGKRHRPLLFVAIIAAFFVFSIMDASAQSSQIQGARDNTQVYSGVVYGPIDENDTLWRIASRYKQDSQFSVYQTMMAIYDLNPQAFEGGNFNAMVNGATLQLPSDKFIARIDPQIARAKADADDRAMGKSSSGQNQQSEVGSNTSSTDSAPARPNLKPEVPLVNQEELSKTSSQLQSQLNGLRQQQQQQFMQLKNQVAASINSVQVLIEENKKLNSQLLQIDDNSRKLTENVETELQTQIDQQVAQLSQLIGLVKEAEQRRIDKESKSFINQLTSPVGLVIIMSSLTIIVISSIAFFLMRKPASTINDDALVGQNNKGPANTPSDTMDDELSNREVGGKLNQDSDGSMEGVASDDDLDLDDILSDALEDDLIDDNELEHNLASELADLDNMLVPDSRVKDSASNSEKNAQDEESGAIEALDDELSLDYDDVFALDNEDSISLDDDDDLSAMLDAAENAERTNELEVESDLSKEDIQSFEGLFDEDESENDSPKGIKLDENGEINENTIEQIEEQINRQDATISRMADDILDELDNNSKGGADNQELPTKDSVDDKLSNDNISDDNDDLSEELLSELESDDASTQELDSLLDSMDDEESSVKTQDTIEADESDAIVDLDDDNSDKESDALNNQQVSALADDLLQELENESQESDELDSLLNEFDIGEESNPIDPNFAESQESTFAPSTAKEETASRPLPDTDDLLDDIPSFTSSFAMQQDEAEQSDEEPQDKPTNDELNQHKNTKDSAKGASKDPNREVRKSAKSKLTDTPKPEPKNNASLDNKAQPKVAPGIAEEELLGNHKAQAQDQDPLDVLDESDEDVLSGLEGLDNWLDEEDQQLSADTDTELDLSALSLGDDELESLNDGIDKNSNDSFDDELMQGLDEANFDDILDDLALKDDDKTSSSERGNNSRPFDDAGLDLDALMDDKLAPDTSKNTSPKSQNKDAKGQGDVELSSFVDVDDLLEQSDDMVQKSDNEIQLDLDNSLDRLGPQHQDYISLSTDTGDEETNQASNLDLAQVYIDMEDTEAAIELLDEVVKLGTPEQKDEATMLLASIAS